MSQKLIDDLSWFFACSYKLRKTKSYFNNYLVDMIKNGFLGHGTLKSAYHSNAEMNWAGFFWYAGTSSGMLLY